jgi:hypothetical protein
MGMCRLVGGGRWRRSREKEWEGDGCAKVVTHGFTVANTNYARKVIKKVVLSSYALPFSVPSEDAILSIL